MLAVLDSPLDLLSDKTPTLPTWGKLVVIAGLAGLAWAVARLSAVVARKVLDWHDRIHRESEEELIEKIARIKRRETLVSLIRAGVTYAAVAAAAILAVAQLTGGFGRLTAVAGASFALILAGFAIQRVLTDLIAGVAMFAERWYSVGDTIMIPGLELQGVVEDVSLRRTRLRTLDGEVIHVHNSQIPAVRVQPRGLKDLAIELFASDEFEAERVVEAARAILPEGPTTFIRRPSIELVEQLSTGLVRMRLRATVAPGREWLAESFFPDLLKERAAAGLIVHGPVVFAVDEGATRSYARATATTRWQLHRPAA